MAGQSVKTVFGEVNLVPGLPPVQPEHVQWLNEQFAARSDVMMAALMNDFVGLLCAGVAPVEPAPLAPISDADLVACRLLDRIDDLAAKL